MKKLKVYDSQFDGASVVMMTPTAELTARRSKLKFARNKRNHPGPISFTMNNSPSRKSMEPRRSNLPMLTPKLNMATLVGDPKSLPKTKIKSNNVKLPTLGNKNYI